MSVDQSATDTSTLPMAGFTLKLEYEVCFLAPCVPQLVRARATFVF